jgi:hypothetical protein
LFGQVWEQIGGADGDALHCLTLAHAMADVQEDPHDELQWDLRALDAAGRLTDDRAAQAGVAFGVAAFYPSLHLNLGDVYRRLGDVERAREHCRLGQEATGHLPDDGYGRQVRGGLARLAARLGGD